MTVVLVFFASAMILWLLQARCCRVHADTLAYSLDKLHVLLDEQESLIEHLEKKRKQAVASSKYWKGREELAGRDGDAVGAFAEAVMAEVAAPGRLTKGRIRSLHNTLLGYLYEGHEDSDSASRYDIPF